MQSRARLVILSALILLVVAGSVLSWALESNVVEETTAQPIQENFLEGACQEEGVTVVVDFGEESELEPIVRCAKDFAGTGWDVFQATGIEVAGTNQYPVGFACQIESFPSTAIQNCIDTPKYSEGSWGYFVATDDSGWKVSPVGSAARNSACGTSEGWLFIGPGQQDAGLVPNVVPEFFTCND